MTDLSRPTDGHAAAGEKICHECEKLHEESSSIGLNGGWYCSPECFEKALKRKKAHIDALREAWLAEGTE